jgi:hypothetical protein
MCWEHLDVGGEVQVVEAQKLLVGRQGQAEERGF